MCTFQGKLRTRQGARYHVRAISQPCGRVNPLHTVCARIQYIDGTGALVCLCMNSITSFFVSSEGKSVEKRCRLLPLLVTIVEHISATRSSRAVYIHPRSTTHGDLRQVRSMMRVMVLRARPPSYKVRMIAPDMHIFGR